MPLDAICERDADAATAALYADIRRTLGVPAVNLVWRHLASIDGALHWVWPRVRPLYRSAALAHAAAAVRASGRLADVEPVSLGGLADAGADADALATIRRVLASYERSNPPNLVVIQAVLLALSGAAAGPLPALTPVSSAPPDAAPLPPLIASADMATATRDLALRFDAAGRTDGRA
ncbi:MAG: hypothetical protein ACU85V_11365, partial [Gammaproteobacteria bacterium]